MAGSNHDFKPPSPAKTNAQSTTNQAIAHNDTKDPTPAADSKQAMSHQSAKLFSSMLNHKKMTALITPLLNNQEEANLSRSCREAHSLFCKDLEQRKRDTLQKLLQAVVDDDRETAEKIANAHPNLLDVEPIDEKVISIESKYTFQQFFAENALIMAQKLNRLAITKIFVIALKKHEAKQHAEAKDTKNEKTILQKRWILKPYDEKQHAANKALRLAYKQKYLNPIANTIKADPCEIDQKMIADMIATGNLNARPKIARSQLTENALATLRNQLLPTSPVKIDDSINPEQFLLAAYEVYYDNPNQLHRQQLELFAIHVIGFAQSLLSPEFAKAYCYRTGLYDYTQANEPDFDKLAMEMKLGADATFYRVSREAQTGLGFDSYCSTIIRRYMRNRYDHRDNLFQRLCEKRTIEFNGLTQQVTGSPNAFCEFKEQPPDLPKPHTHRRCVIQ